MGNNNSADLDAATQREREANQKYQNQVAERRREDESRQAELAAKQTRLRDVPWRKLSVTWNFQKRAELIEELKAYTPDAMQNVSKAHIIMTGPVSAGKSSLVNTLQSVLNGHIVTGKAMAGTAAESLTTIYRNYHILSEARGKPLPFELMDTMGLSKDNSGMPESTFEHVIQGNIKIGFDFGGSDLANQKLYFSDEKCSQTHIHLVMIVLNATLLEYMADSVKDKLKGFQSQCAKRNMPLVVVLTHIDELCEHVNEDTANVFRSPKVEKAVKATTAMVGVSTNTVFPIRNYSDEFENDIGTDILCLLAFTNMMRQIDQYLYMLTM